MSDNAVAVYDLTIPLERNTLKDVKEFMKDWAKKWVFQLEEADGGYQHWQARVSLNKKRRLCEIIKATKDELCGHHWSITSSPNAKGDFSYVMKKDTRIDGPWTDKDEEDIYIPRQYRGLETQLRPWQQAVWDCADQIDDRHINFLYDPRGNNGKSTIVALMCLHKRAIRVPAVNDKDMLVASVCDILMGKRCREPKCMFVDMPRAMDKRHLGSLYAAIEEFKVGCAMDMRYRYREWWFDSPQVWVFGNVEPNLNYMSMDRWKIWTINDGELEPVPIVPTG